MADRRQTGERPVQKDRRRTLRNPLPVLKVKVDENRRVFFGYARNISRGGFFITTLNPREIGATFSVELTIPDPVNRTVQALCEVVWARSFSKGSAYDPGMGLRFCELAEDIGEAIDSWIHAHEDDPGKVVDES